MIWLGQPGTRTLSHKLFINLINGIYKCTLVLSLNFSDWPLGEVFITFQELGLDHWPAGMRNVRFGLLLIQVYGLKIE